MTKYIIITIIALLIIYILYLFNQIIKLNNKVNEAFSTMDIYLKKRWDLIPNLVEVVKNYTKHEKDTLEGITKLRSNIATYDNMSTDNKIKVSEQITNDLNNILLLAEAYPNLKADTSFINLSTQLTKIEEDIANSRKYYNATVRKYNNKIQVFPNNIISKLFNAKPKLMFEATNNERENIKIKL